MKSTQFRRAVVGGLGELGVMCHRGASVWRSSLQTLLVAAGCGGVLGLLSGRLYRYPGSPRRGSADPGLNYATPLGLVWGGVVGETGRTSHFKTMFESTQERLQKAFIQISQSRTRDDLASADSAFREAFLAYGSETPDNVKAASSVSVKEFDREWMSGFGGLALSELGQPISAILHEAEGCEIPRQVSLAFPEMKQSEWNAALRLVTMVLSMFESDNSCDETNLE